MKKKIGAIICFMLLLSITSSIVSSQEIEAEAVLYKLKSENTPPYDPLITGPDEVIKNKFFSIKIMTTDPEGDKIFYRLKINDAEPSNWWGPLNSGYEDKFYFRFLFFTGDLIFGAQAKDENGALSDWSYHKVSYINPRLHNTVGNTLLSFLQRLFCIIN